MLPNDAAQPIAVSSIELDAAGGTLALTAAEHSISGGKQVVEVSGLGEALDGLYAVWKGGGGKPVVVNAGKRAVGAADEAAVAASVTGGDVTIK